MKLVELSAAAYAREVLPLTAGLWAAGRDFATYAAHTKAIAAGTYGKKYFRTLALTDETGAVLASCKRYERTLHFGERKLTAVGIGAVFTPPQRRGGGYATAMLAMVLDAARAAGHDAAYLFSDIHPAFYAQLGFVELPSRSISLRADSLSAARAPVSPIAASDAAAVRRCFERTEALRPWGFVRAPVVWDWIALRNRQGSEHPSGAFVQLGIRRGKSIIAYVMGVRDPQRDAFVLDEFGFADLEGRGRIPALIRSAAGDLRRITGWLPPEGVRDLLPRGSVRRRTGAIFMMAPLSSAGKKLAERASAPSAGDGVWATDHI